MYSVINRISWLFAITAFVAIWSIDEDFVIFAFVVAVIIKVLLRKDFIEEWIRLLKNEIETEIIEKISGIWLKQKDLQKLKDTIVFESKTINENINNDNLKSLSNNEEINETKEFKIDENLVNKEVEYDEEAFNNTKFQESIDEKEYQEISREPSKIWLFLKDFFAENLMAKIGWILLSLWAMFFMYLVYNVVWDVAKVMIGFALWFWIYVIWIKLYSKWYESESMILLWTWILINYIVILTWKFIIFDWDNSVFATSWITFLLLILNSLFSVVTAFIYKSKNLLLFSIIFAYVIPFLTWWNYKSYVLVGYSLILSLWWFAIWNYFYKNDDTISSKQIIFISLIWWNILLLLASLYDTSDFVIKMIGYNILNFLSIYVLYKNKFEKNLLASFLISYVFLAFLMFSWSSFTWLSILVSFIFAVLWLLLINSFFIISSVWAGLIYLIFFPILFVLGFIFIWWAWSAIILLPLFLISYLLVFAFWVWWALVTSLKYVFFALIGAFLLIWNTFVIINLWIDSNTFFSIVITSFMFLFSTYYLSNKNELHYLYTLWTLATIFLLLPILQIKWDFFQFSIIAMSVFWLSNYLLPFINSNLVKNDSENLVLWSIFGILFLWWNLYRYWTEYFPWVSLWLWFLALAILYFIGWFILFNKIEIKQTENKVSDLNFIYAFLWIAISLFSISVALIFAKMPAIVAMIWLFQSSVVFFFANKLNKQKIYFAWVVLFIIWLAKFWHYFSFLVRDLYIQSNNIWLENIINKGWFVINYFNHLLGIIFIWISIFLNIVIFRKTEFKSTIWVNILHIVWVLMLWLNVVYLFTDYIAEYLLYRNNFWIVYIIIWAIIFMLTIIYNSIWNKFTKWVLLFFTSLFLLSHIFLAGEFDNYNLNYVFTIMIWIIYFIDRISLESWKIDLFKPIINAFWVIFWIYVFIITSIYLYDATSNYFSLTIYWWLLSLLFVHLWIFKENKKLRWIWLLLLIITLLKIVFYDIWNSIDNWIVRVIAFMFVGGIMIYFSSLYKKNWLAIKDDLNFSSLSENEKKQEENKIDKKVEVNKVDNDINTSRVNKDLDNIDIWDKKSITFIFNDWRKVRIRAKNLIKMWFIVIKEAWKNVFEKWELKRTYKYIKNNYKSELSKKDYDKIIEIIESFIETWWKIEIE